MLAHVYSSAHYLQLGKGPASTALCVNIIEYRATHRYKAAFLPLSMRAGGGPFSSWVVTSSGPACLHLYLVHTLSSSSQFEEGEVQLC